MDALNNKYGVVAGWYPINKTAAAVSHVISMKNYNVAEFYIMTAAAITAAFAVTMDQGVSIASCDTDLEFDRYYESGCRLKYDGASSEVPAAAGETATGTGTAVGTVYEDLNGELILYNRNNDQVFVDDEVLTFSGGKLAVVDGVFYDEDIMVPRVVTLDTFTITNVVDINKMYMVPIHSSMLNEAAGMDCVELNIADPTAAILACFVVLNEPRYGGTPMPTAFYD